VMVDFEQANPNDPYVCDTLYHGNTKPEHFDPDNNLKSIKTRSGHTVLFNDEAGGESITIKDRNGNEILIDTVGNNMTITALENMTLNARNVNVNAGENINFNAGVDIGTSAGANITEQAGDNIERIAGSAIEVNAGTSISSNAGLNVNLNADGKADIRAKGNIGVDAKGALIQQGGQGASLTASAVEISGKSAVQIN